MFFFHGPANGGVLDQVVHLVLVLVVKGRDSYDHLVNKNSQCPPVQRVVMSRPDNHLWCQVLRGTAKRIRILLVIDVENFCEPEVGQHNVAVLVQQDVLRLEISVNNFGVVEVAKGKSNLCCVKLSLVFGEALLLRKVFEELSALDKVHYKVDPVGFLEDVVHADDEGMVHLQQYKLLHLK